jgi:dUTP pyrophosphatase
MIDNNQSWNEIERKLQELMDESSFNLNEDYSDIQNLLNGDLAELTEEMEKMYKSKKILVEKIHPDAVFPKYAYPSDSGFDLHSTEKITIEPFGRFAIPTGLKVSFNEGYELQVRPKSGLALNMGLTVLNTPGTVDQGYTGEIKVIIFNTNNSQVIIEKGMKVAQAVLCPVINGKYVILEEVEGITSKDRGDNGFGSTGII